MFCVMVQWQQKLVELLEKCKRKKITFNLFKKIATIPKQSKSTILVSLIDNVKFDDFERQEGIISHIVILHPMNVLQWQIKEPKITTT